MREVPCYAFLKANAFAGSDLYVTCKQKAERITNEQDIRDFAVASDGSALALLRRTGKAKGLDVDGNPIDIPREEIEVISLKPGFQARWCPREPGNAELVSSCGTVFAVWHAGSTALNITHTTRDVLSGKRLSFEPYVTFRCSSDRETIVGHLDNWRILKAGLPPQRVIVVAPKNSIATPYDISPDGQYVAYVTNVLCVDGNGKNLGCVTGWGIYPRKISVSDSGAVLFDGGTGERCYLDSAGNFSLKRLPGYDDAEECIGVSYWRPGDNGPQLLEELGWKPQWITPQAAAALRAWAGPRAKQTQEPLWRVDLRSFGYTGFEPREEQWDARLRAGPICFIGRSAVLAAFVTREESRGLARRSDPQTPFPLKLHAVVLDSSTGQPHTVREWPTERPRAGVIPVVGGRFIVLNADKMVLHSADLEALKEFTLPTVGRSDVLVWGTFASPTGRSILLQYQVPQAFNCLWIDGYELGLRRSWTDSVAEALGWWGGISDQKLAKPHEFHSPPYGSEVLIRELDGAWQAVCRERLGCGNPTFVNESALLLQTTYEMTLIRTTGEVLFRQTVPRNTTFHHYYPLVAAAERDRFAVLLVKEKGGFPLLDIMPDFVFDQAMVYDMTRRQWVFTLYAKKARLKNFAGLALSPDGTRMAVLADGILQVFAVPDGPP